MKIRKKIKVIITVENKNYSEAEKTKLLLEYFALLGEWHTRQNLKNNHKTKQDEEIIRATSCIKHILSKLKALDDI